MTIMPSFQSAIERLLPAAMAERVQTDADASAYQQAAEWLHERIRAISRFVPAHVVRAQLAGGAPALVSGGLRRGTLVFADLSGFTALTEQLGTLGREGSEEITRIINRLFAAFTGEITGYGGDLIKFNGDALTAFFDAEILGAEHVLAATTAAAKIQERMGELGTVATRLGTFPLAMRIGVHSGEAFAAMLGDESHQELVLVGADVNHVARAQEAAKPGEVVISAATNSALGGIGASERPGGFWTLGAFERSGERPQVLAIPAPSADPAGLEQLLALYSGLRRYLPINLTESQAMAEDGFAAGGLRLVAALFAHIAPFSTIVDHYRGDPERVVPLLNAYYSRMQAIVTHYGGSINKLDLAADGDKLLAIFGAPIAHENDAELALRAGIDMQDAINELNVEFQISDPSLPLIEQRIGINQGHVFAGIVGGGQRHEYSVMGDSVNVAARLMAKTPPGDILVGPAIRRNSPSFEFEVLEPLQLKGKHEPIAPARIIQHNDSRREGVRMPLVGRGAELEQIEALGAAALGGSGGLAAIVGEAGIGKSRLLQEGLQLLTLASLNPSGGIPDFMPLGVECQFYEQTTPFASASDLIGQLLRLRPTQTPAQQTAQLQRKVAQLIPRYSQFLPLLGDLLHVPIEETSLTKSLSPDQRHQLQIQLMCDLIIASAQAAPLVIIWDDLHWIDASSLELLHKLAQGGNNAPYLVLVAYRQEARFAPEWGPAVVEIEVSELSDHERIELAEAYIGGSPLPDDLIARWGDGDEAVFNPQGNPFFIGEMMRALLDSGVLRRGDGGWQLQGDIAEIPTTIEGVITARLDRLDAIHRETVQIASVVGRRFQLAILGAIAASDDIPHHIQVLAENDLVEDDQHGGGAAYIFKHTLTRDVAYESILYARRRELHRRVAEHIESFYGRGAEDLLPVLARHYMRAEEWDLALAYYLQAGKVAQGRYANLEAIANFEAALEMLGSLPDAPLARRVEINERLGYALLQAGNYADALSAFEEAYRDAQGDADPDGLSRLLRHIATVHERRSDFETAFGLVAQAMELLGSATSREAVRILLSGAGLHQRLGRYDATIDWAERALAMAERLGLVVEQARSYLLIGGCLRLLARYNEAIAALERSLGLYQEADDIAHMADAYVNLANTMTDIGNTEQAIHYFNQAYTIKHSINDIYGQALALHNLGDLYLRSGSYPEALSASEQGLDYWRSLGSKLGIGVSLMNIGKILLKLGRLETAHERLRESRVLLEELTGNSFMPELERASAELALARVAYDEALDYSHAARQAAQRLQARPEEVLALLLQGRILKAQGHTQAALDHTQEALAISQETGSSLDIVACQEQLALFSQA